MATIGESRLIVNDEMCVLLFISKLLVLPRRAIQTRRFPFPRREEFPSSSIFNIATMSPRNLLVTTIWYLNFHINSI